jgi:4-hydroxy-tetrahydrodipicolinate reductase
MAPVTTDLDPGWTIPFPGQGWHVVVNGDLPLDVTIRFAFSSPEQGGRQGYGNANRPVNAVPYVCEAPQFRDQALRVGISAL